MRNLLRQIRMYRPTTTKDALVDDGRSPRRFLAFWIDSSRGLRILVVIMWAVGGALFGGGWYLDNHGWWEHRPFVTNLASAFTGAFFAIPIAILVVQWIIRSEAEWSQKTYAMLQARRTLEELINIAYRLIGGPEQAEELKSVFQNLRTRADSIIEWYAKLEDIEVESRLRALKEALHAAGRPWCTSAARWYVATGDLISLRNSWQLFVEHIRPRLATSGLVLSGGSKSG